MSMLAMDHYTVLTADMAGSVDFYRKVLGLKPGWSPKVDVPVTWLYIGRQAVLHLVGRKPQGRSTSTGRFDHVAFRCQGYAATKRRLRRHGIEFMEQHLPAIGLNQLFLAGPEGVWVELIFRPNDAAGPARRRRAA